MDIRLSEQSDAAGIWEIFQQVIASADSYVFPQDADQALFQKHWMKYRPIVATENEQIVGSYIIKENQMGLGNHIANGSYMVHPDHHGKGIGKKLGQHSLELARARGFKAMQFNIVVATNAPAVALWKKLGFRIIGTTPKAFRHPQHGYVDAHIMYRDLQHD
ncbi:GNAT family N-acetyltransferase [Coraliomargarita sp. SDUM461004]|uniref:GNAT family N-acetyltransferase n=1 Tax=Thalassobacterium sedimentorum TaxID=3041258 RepID=A0ABU1AHB5_9BACT|nr:GNAT family N-acetyltransferase [Coraliomargarita sp. SDUM461004]MDQ8194210.1 GNAT family N-acetyltransferase [Coraliomargarita sp. SDUM461004]